MESLIKFIDNHTNSDKTRSSFSNLIKKIKLENEFFLFIDRYLDFGTFKQKLTILQITKRVNLFVRFVI